MTSALVHLARSQGVILWAEGGRLRYRSSKPLPASLVGLLGAEKLSILAYLTDWTLEALCAGLALEDAQALREERAGILEFDGGIPREEAVRRAGIVWTAPRSTGHVNPSEAGDNPS